MAITIAELPNDAIFLLKNKIYQLYSKREIHAEVIKMFDRQNQAWSPVNEDDEVILDLPLDTEVVVGKMQTEYYFYPDK